MKALVIILFVVLFSGCSMTSPPVAAPVQTLEPPKRIDKQCADQVFTRVGRTNTEIGAFIAVAENAQACINDMRFNPQHPDNHLAMQLQAIAVKSYVKAGDITSAKTAFNDFRNHFPKQDLVYSDFTSFVDTATALLMHRELSAFQLSRLNINSTLKAELSRQQRWTIQ